MKEKIAVYAGSFDPPTLGHLWMIEQGALVFDKLIVAIGINPGKDCLFSMNERLAMLKASTAHLANISIQSYPNRYLVHYARNQKAKFILRGIRSAGDFEAENTMHHINADIGPDVVTFFLMPPPNLRQISSSAVKGLVGPADWRQTVKKYVPAPVFNAIIRKRNEKRWLALAKRIGLDDQHAQNIFFNLVERYAEKHRYYHTLEHIDECLEEFDEIKDLLECPDEVETAIWFHDAIYDIGQPDNEEKSAQMAKVCLAKLPDGFIDRIRQLIYATKHNDLAFDDDARYMADIDLAILAKPEAAFDEYSAAIRKEYGHLSDETYNPRRMRFLKAFLKQSESSAIFQTNFYYKSCEDRLRENLRRAIAQLEK